MSDAFDLSEPLRTAIIGSAGIVALLGTYAGAPAVLTRRPTPTDELVNYPIIIISPDTAVINEDGLHDFRPTVTRDIVIYAANSTPAEYRLADTLMYLVRELFHRQRNVISLSNWDVVDIQVTNQTLTSQDDQVEGRVVTLAIRLAKLRT